MVEAAVPRQPLVCLRSWSGSSEQGELGTLPSSVTLWAQGQLSRVALRGARGAMWGCTGSTFLSLQEQLRRLYPRLKVLALGARPETTLHTYFPSFLSRATPSCPPAMRKEVRRGAEG